MNHDTDREDIRVAAYSVARYGVGGAAIRYALDRAVEHATPARVLIPLAAILILVLVIGSGGKVFLLACVAGGVALWRKARLEEAAMLLGKDSADYVEFTKIDSLEEGARADYRADWLLHGPPRTDEPRAWEPQERPRFGRKKP